MSSLLNKAKEKIDATLNKDKNNDNYGEHGTHGTHGTQGTHGTHTGSHAGGMTHDTHTGTHGHTGGAAPIHHSTTQGAGGYGSSTNNPSYDNPQSTAAGPHSSNLMNKADPRVDSDRDHRNDPTSRVGGYGAQGDNYGHSAGVGNVGTTGAGYGNTAGGYGDNTGYAGQQGYSGQQGHTGHNGGLAAAAGTTGSGYGGPGAYDNPRSANEGPHGSNLMNKADPRVDSDRDHRNDPTSRVGGYGAQGDNYGHSAGVQGGYGGTGTTGTTGTTGGYGAGSTGAYDSGATGGYGSGITQGHGAGTTGTHQHGGHGHAGQHAGQHTGQHGGHDQSQFTPGSGQTSKTAGPHNSDMMNKLDPRVDSDMDGSKTYGGNATHQ